MARSSALYRSSTRSKYKFPVLEVVELVALYRTMQFTVSEADLLRPSPAFMRSLLEQILDKFLLVSPAQLRQRVSSGGDDAEIRASINIVMAQRTIYKFLCDCGVDDFSIRDVSKPDSSRLRIILSALVNYARFREQRMADCVDLLESNEDLLMQYRQLLMENSQYETQIVQLNQQIEMEGHNLQDVNAKNQQLESHLISLKKDQEQIAADHEIYRNEKSVLVKELENQSAIYIEAEKGLEQVRPYLKESPESIKELISKMADSKQREVEILTQLENRNKELPISLQSFQLSIQDFTSLNKLLDELIQEANKQNALDEKLQLVKQQIGQKDEEFKELNRSIHQVEHQVKQNEERLLKLKSFYDEKMSSFEKRIQDQLHELNEIKTQHNTNDVQTLEKEVQITTWQRQMKELDQAWESECKDASFMIEKLNAQVNVYINEMTKRVNDFDL